MKRSSAAHNFLVRSLAELGARDSSLLDTSLPVNSIPVVGPLASPLVDSEDNGSQQPPSPTGNPSSNNPPDDPPPDSPPPAATPTTGDGDGDGDGGGSTPTSSPIPTSGEGAAFELVAPSPTIPISTAGDPSSTPSVQDDNSGGGTPSSLSPGGGPVSSGQAAPTVASPPLSPSMPFGALASNYLEASKSSLGFSSGTISSLVPSSTTAAALSSGERLSGGTIAGITVVCLFSFLSIILLVFRRRSIAHRVALRELWWFNRARGGGGFSSAGGSRSPMNANGEVSGSRLSARSSFATNFDQGLMFRVDPPSGCSLAHVPDYPPMAEVRERNSVLISTGAAVARKTSMNSMLSHGSDSDIQYHPISTSQNNPEAFTPMSVRPFSPSESFFFPKPPAPSSRDSFLFPGTQGHTSIASSATTLVQVSPPPPALIDLPPTSGAISRSLTTGAALSPHALATNTFPDPFAETVKPEFAEIEVIRRPFIPSLDDELMVYPGDHVCIFRIFDDGWAFVEVLADADGKRHKRGLIPVDCLRDADQPLPAFLAQKRVSYGSEQLGCAL